jgi:transcriptional regulator with XRE-family HTH domain
MSQKSMPRKRNRELQDAYTLLVGLATSEQEPCCSNETLVGARLRTLRHERGLSIRTLAAKCGLSTNTLSLVENDRTSPSVHTLQLLARGLGLPLVAFFEEERPGYGLVFQQRGQRTCLRFANGTVENLGEGLPPLGAEPILVTLDPGQADAKDISHVGREFIYCLDGEVTCIVAGREYTLSPGDSLLFDARAAHHWLNTHPAPSKLLVLFCPMEARDQPAERHLDH